MTLTKVPADHRIFEGVHHCFGSLDPCPKRAMHDFVRVGNMSWWMPVYGDTPFFYQAKRAVALGWVHDADQ